MRPLQIEWQPCIAPSAGQLPTKLQQCCGHPRMIPMDFFLHIGSLNVRHLHYIYTTLHHYDFGNAPANALGQASCVRASRAPANAATMLAAACGGPARLPAAIAATLAAAATAASSKHAPTRRFMACSLDRLTPSRSADSSGTSAWNAAGTRSAAELASRSCSLQQNGFEEHQRQVMCAASEYLSMWLREHAAETSSRSCGREDFLRNR